MLKELYSLGNSKQKQLIAQWLNVVNENNYDIEFSNNEYTIRAETVPNDISVMEDNVVKWLLFTKAIEQFNDTYTWI